MQTINKSICLIVFLVLVVANSMAGTVVSQAEVNHRPDRLIKKLGDTYCTTATIHDYSCHTECHNTTTYIRDCDTYNGTCDELTTHFNLCNSTGCRNTTRHIHACYNDNCGDAHIHYNSCYETHCLRNRTTHIHACYDDQVSNVNLFNIACAAAGAFADGAVRAFLDATCVDRLIAAFRPRLQ